MFPLLVLKWIHILCVIGTFGGLVAVRFGLPADVRNSEDVARTSARLFNILIGVGLLAGLSVYVLNHGMSLGPHYNGVIGLKFVILVAVGGLIPMSRKPGKGDLFRTIAIVLLAIAALAGASI
jgi:hypothetical protein